MKIYSLPFRVLYFFLTCSILETACYPVLHGKNLEDSLPLFFAGQEVKMRITVIQDYGKAKDAILPIKTITSRLLKAAGFDIGDPNCDLLLSITVKGKALGEKCTDGYYHYSGAKINGAFYFDSAGVKKDANKFQNRIETGDNFCIGSKDPSKAPFGDAFYLSDFFEDLAAVLKKNYGVYTTLQYWLGALNEKEDALRNKAIRELGILGDERAVKPLIKLIDKAYVGDALASIGEPAIDPLLILLRSLQKDRQNDKSIAKIASILGDIGDKRAFQPIIDLYRKTNSKYLQLWYACALFKLGDESKFEILTAALSDEKYRSEAIWVLRHTNHMRAFIPLLEIMKKYPDHVDALNAWEGLKKISGKNYGENPDFWLEWWEENKEN